LSSEIVFQALSEKMTSAVPPTLIDSRAWEYSLWETIQGSVNLRWKEVEQRAQRMLPDTNQEIVTFCQNETSESSAKAQKALLELGYTNVSRYRGGIDEWRIRGGALTRSHYRISERSMRLPSQKFYGEEVGSYLIDTQDALIIVDGPQFLSDGNEDFILSFNKPIIVLLTHGATGGVASILQTNYDASIILHESDIDNEWLICQPTNMFNSDVDFLSDLKILHTPGHTPGSCCIYDAREKLLYSGDHIQGSSTSQVFDFINAEEQRGNHAQQLESIRRLLPLEIRAIHPFHYSPITENPRSALDDFLHGVSVKS